MTVHLSAPAADRPARRPQLVAAPRGLRATISADVAATLFRHAAARLPLHVEFADGTTAGSTHPDAPRMFVHRPRDFATRLGTGGLIGFGEAYMAGDWSATDPAATLTVFATHIETLVPRPLQWLRRCHVASPPDSERNTPTNARTNVGRHYDLSNDVFRLFLDETMTYSGALFPTLAPPPRRADLANAQRAKIDRLLDRARVGPETELLEIGTGWGELAVRAATRGARVRSVTLSVEQQSLARERVAAAGVSDRVRFDLRDYREIEGRFDAVISVEMIEAVGHEYLDGFFRTLERLLAPNGRAAIQAITMPHHRMRATRNSYTWIQKYIFPGGFLPSRRLLDEVIARSTELTVHEHFSMGEHYAHTLRLWRERFDAETDAIGALGFDPVFRRMWQVYLAHAEAGFRSGYLDVGQLLLVPRSSPPSRQTPARHTVRPNI